MNTPPKRKEQGLLHVCLLFFAVVFVIFLVMAAIASLYILPEENFQLAPSTTTEKDLIGTWKIDNIPFMLFNSEPRKNWQKTRLYLYDNGEFKMENLTEEQKTDLIDPPIDNDENIVIQGVWKIVSVSGIPMLALDGERYFLRGDPVLLKTDQGFKINWTLPYDEDIYSSGEKWIKISESSP